MITSIEIIEQSDETFEEDSDDENIELPEGLAPEEKVEWPDSFVLSAGQDWDILLHRLSNGVRIGQFAQDELWNIYDMTQYDKIKPRYVREWLKEKKAKWIELVSDRLLNARKAGLIQEEESKVPVRLSTKDQLKQMGINIGMGDNNSLDGSLDNISTGYDDLDINVLESEDEDLKDQD